MKAYSPEAEKRRLSSPHAALRQVLASEERRRSRPDVYGYAFDQPKFDEPFFQTQLKTFNALAFALASVRAKCEVRTHRSWTEGIGERYTLSLSALIGDSRLTFVFEAEPRSRVKPPARDAPYQPALILEASRVGEEPDRWQARPELPLEKQLRQITAVALTKAEQRLRAAEVHKHAHMIGRIEEEKQRAEASRLEDIRLASERAAAESKAREEALKAEANRWHQAEQLRSYMAAVAAKHPESTAWQVWALSVADGMDPLNAETSTFLQHPGS
ncbi:MAG: hypothetical protein EOO27_00990 [Comamonadaceae bacterium]|nr:MAG: hypothetical protein EOO27_00990 [Comamonadaceae bacterium]